MQFRSVFFFYSSWKINLIQLLPFKWTNTYILTTGYIENVIYTKIEQKRIKKKQDQKKKTNTKICSCLHFSYLWNIQKQESFLFIFFIFFRFDLGNKLGYLIKYLKNSQEKKKEKWKGFSILFFFSIFCSSLNYLLIYRQTRQEMWNATRHQKKKGRWCREKETVLPNWTKI